MFVAQLVEILKDAGEDREFYPSTQEIIDALIKDIPKREYNYHHERKYGVLDIGAGNGKVLNALRDAKLGITDFYAIEKSSILCEQLDPDILIIGTDFFEQSLLSKPVDIIFCNPRYSEFARWAEKIIREAAANTAYLVIPKRWKNSIPIQDAIKFRDADCEVIGSFDFEDAEDRKARAYVDLVKISFHNREDDAFQRFFNEQFADVINKFKEPERKKDDEESKNPEVGRKRPFHQLVIGPAYPQALVNLYNQEMANIQKNYHLIGQLDVDLLREFEISPPRIMECLKARLKGLKNDYWHELFSNLNTITDRLTSDSRKTLLNTLHKHVSVDFTLDNIYAIIIWVIKNANNYIDSQLIKVYELMVSKANVILYKSNQKTFIEDRWRYMDEESKNSHYSLDYRIVTHRVGGVSNSEFLYDKGLKESAAIFLGDLVTIANNLGFRAESVQNCLLEERQDWKPGKSYDLYFENKGKDLETLYEVKAFKNGNLHLRLNKKFILALNVEYGRLKGWLKNAKEAVEELKDPEAARFFKSNIQIANSSFLLLKS